MIGNSRSSLGPTFAAVLGLAQIFGCGGPNDDAGLSDQSLAAQKAKKDKQDKEDKEDKDALKACHLDDGSLGPDDRLHVCDAASTKKTTICHVPPGNPGNAHTLCIGNPAVGPHVHHHGDYLGPCKAETPCPPPGDGAGGAPGTGGQPAAGGAPGTGGEPAAGGTTGTGGGGGTSTPPASQCEQGRISCGPTGDVSMDGCPAGTACTGGCCWRIVE